MSYLSKVWNYLKGLACKVLGLFGLCEESKAPAKEAPKSKSKTKSKKK